MQTAKALRREVRKPVLHLCMDGHNLASVKLSYMQTSCKRIFDLLSVCDREL